MKGSRNNSEMTRSQTRAVAMETDRDRFKKKEQYNLVVKSWHRGAQEGAEVVRVSEAEKGRLGARAELWGKSTSPECI